MTTESPLLTCPACGCRQPIEQVLDHCDASWPAESLLYSRCPRCHRKHHLRVRDEHAGVGYLDVTPGPGFVTQAEVNVPGMWVIEQDDGLEVRLEERSWFVPARD